MFDEPVFGIGGCSDQGRHGARIANLAECCDRLPAGSGMIGPRDLHQSWDCFRIVAHAGASGGGDANAEIGIVEGGTDSGASFRMY